MLDEAIVRQIAAAVEARHGDLTDVQDLVSTYERMQARLRAANAAAEAGLEHAAEREWARLEAEYARPLEDVAKDHIGRRSRP
jgi:hypothetical protein